MKQCVSIGLVSIQVAVNSPSGPGLDHSRKLSNLSLKTAQKVSSKYVLSYHTLSQLTATRSSTLEQSPHTISETLELVDTFRITFMPLGPQATRKEAEGLLGQLLCCVEEI